jgi:hypothetical protein
LLMFSFGKAESRFSSSVGVVDVVAMSMSDVLDVS